MTDDKQIRPSSGREALILLRQEIRALSERVDRLESEGSQQRDKVIQGQIAIRRDLTAAVDRVRSALDGQTAATQQQTAASRDQYQFLKEIMERTQERMDLYYRDARTESQDYMADTREVRDAASLDAKEARVAQVQAMKMAVSTLWHGGVKYLLFVILILVLGDALGLYNLPGIPK